MIGITTENGTLRIVADIPIPNAEGGQWSAARIASLVKAIQERIDAAEFVDGAIREFEQRRPLPARKPNLKSGLVIDS